MDYLKKMQGLNYKFQIREFDYTNNTIAMAMPINIEDLMNKLKIALNRIELKNDI